MAEPHHPDTLVRLGDVLTIIDDHTPVKHEGTLSAHVAATVIRRSVSEMAPAVAACLPDGPMNATGWDAKEIDGRWCVGMRGNLDTIHDAAITVHRFVEDDQDAKALAHWIADTYNRQIAGENPMPDLRGVDPVLRVFELLRDYLIGSDVASLGLGVLREAERLYREALGQSVDLRTAHMLAVDLLSAYEPNDSRAVSDVFVAIASAGYPGHNEAARKIIRDALDAEPVLVDRERPDAWRYRDAWGKWAYLDVEQCLDPDNGPNVVTEKERLFVGAAPVDVRVYSDDELGYGPFSPDDRFYHAADRSWWKKDGERLTRADAPLFEDTTHD